MLRTEGRYVLDAEVDTLKQLVALLEQYDCQRLLIDHRKTDVVVKVLEAYRRPAKVGRVSR